MLNLVEKHHPDTQKNLYKEIHQGFCCFFATGLAAHRGFFFLTSRNLKYPREQTVAHASRICAVEWVLIEDQFLPKNARNFNRKGG